jgi:hypothetical protein
LELLALPRGRRESNNDGHNLQSLGNLPCIELQSVSGSIPKPTKDDELGIAWWNGLSERERARWSREAGNTGRAKDAWEAFKRAQASPGA